MPRLFLIPLLFAAAPLAAQDMSAFTTGPVFEDFGPHAAIEGIAQVPADTEFSVAFDATEPAKDGERNKSIESAARFINMHVAAGVPEDNIRVAVVVHGKAVFDLLDAEARAAHELAENGSAAMIREMLDQGVRIIVCGQSATAHGVSQDQLIPGVEMALSAMTAHALLQQAGYTVNP
ncbi:DsrE family protein [Qipengyuania sp.]|uniref:DsrE family protein n=1 Tax=Qipengyuania sp. TaxID=2004515 RepID=UPI003512C12E